MDPLENPYAPGAGTPPPELAGRDEILLRAATSLERLRKGRAAKNLMIVGLRGTGKTVLLNRLAQEAEAKGFTTLFLEAPENLSLPGLLAPSLRSALLGMSRRQAATDAAKKALRALGSFVKKMSLVYADIKVEVDFGAEPGIADSGDLNRDLTELLQSCGKAAQASETSLALTIDELQYVATEQLGALFTALHRVAQLELPVTLVGAGLPQLTALTGAAKTYAERLFSFEEIGPLDDHDAKQAIEKPANGLGVKSLLSHKLQGRTS